MSKTIIAQSPRSRKRPDRQAPRLTFAQVRESAQRAGLQVARVVGPGLCEVPSATQAGVTYTVCIIRPDYTICSCDAVTDCWHGRRAVELVAESTPVASADAAGAALLQAACTRLAAFLAGLAAPPTPTTVYCEAPAAEPWPVYPATVPTSRILWCPNQDAYIFSDDWEVAA